MGCFAYENVRQLLLAYRAGVTVGSIYIEAVELEIVDADSE